MIPSQAPRLEHSSKLTGLEGRADWLQISICCRFPKGHHLKMHRVKEIDMYMLVPLAHLGTPAILAALALLAPPVSAAQQEAQVEAATAAPFRWCACPPGPPRHLVITMASFVPTATRPRSTTHPSTHGLMSPIPSQGATISRCSLFQLGSSWPQHTIRLQSCMTPRLTPRHTLPMHSTSATLEIPSFCHRGMF